MWAKRSLTCSYEVQPGADRQFAAADRADHSPWYKISVRQREGAIRVYVRVWKNRASQSSVSRNSIFPSTPKRGNLRMHCFVLLGVSSIQLKLKRVVAKQCSLVVESRWGSAARGH